MKNPNDCWGNVQTSSNRLTVSDWLPTIDSGCRYMVAVDTYTECSDGGGTRDAFLSKDTHARTRTSFCLPLFISVRSYSENSKNSNVFLLSSIHIQWTNSRQGNCNTSRCTCNIYSSYGLSAHTSFYENAVYWIRQYRNRWLNDYWKKALKNPPVDIH